MKNQIANIKFNQLLYDSRPVRFDEFISDKYDKIHMQLFNDALSKFVQSEYNKYASDNDTANMAAIYETVQTFKKHYNIIEYKGDEYWQPSTMECISKKYPYSKMTVNLEPFWNNYQNDKNVSLEELRLDEDKLNFDQIELIDIDYIKGKVLIRNKLKNTTFWTTFDRINDKINVGEDYSLQNLFGTKIAF